MRFFSGSIATTAAVWLCALTALTAVAPEASAGVLQSVRDRGHLICGVSDRLPGLSAADASGRFSGLEIEFCGAVAAAVFGESKNVRFRPVGATDGSRALVSGNIDILLGGTTWTFSREAELGMRWAGTLYFEGQALLVPRNFGVQSALELSGASVCVQQDTGEEKAVAAYFEGRSMRYQLVLSEHWTDAVKSYIDGSCTLLTGDTALLAHERSRMAEPRDHLILPEPVTQEQTGPFVRQGDDPWLTLVRWTLMALIEAEQAGLSRETLMQGGNQRSVRVRRFLEQDGAIGASLGLAPNWTERVIAEVGNYGEMFSRTLGDGSRLKLARGANDLWLKGGLLAAPQLR